MKILISGGTGLVGKELGKRLSHAGHEIYVITRNPETSAMDCPYPHKSLSWDQLETQSNIVDVDHIIHLAGAGVADKRWNEEYKKILWNSRVKTTEQLVRFANTKCKNLKSFVSTSATGIYGDQKDKWIHETADKGDGFLAKICLAWENPISQLKTARSVILRFGVVFSPQGGALEQMVPPIQSGLGGPLAGGSQFMSWIDLTDLVSLIQFSIDNEIEGVFNAVAPNPITNKELTQIIADHLNTKAFLNVPFFALRAAVGEVAHSIVESQRVTSEKIEQKGFQFQFPTAKESIKNNVARLKSSERRLIYEQWVPRKKEEVFPFFSDAKNLEKITPDILAFKVLDSSTDPIQKGTIINYKLKINGIPTKWRTHIEEWNPPHNFIDDQLKGPYKKWNHLHQFSDLSGGTLMRDRVDFIIPMGLLGYGLTSWKVLKDINTIFNYRKNIIYKMYFE